MNHTTLLSDLKQRREFILGTWFGAKVMKVGGESDKKKTIVFKALYGNQIITR